jgi:hypothetical protein
MDIKEEILQDIRLVSGVLQHTPTQREFTIQSRKFKGGFVTSHFGSWNRALHAAGVIPTRIRLQSLNKETLVSKLKQLAIEIGRTPTQKDFDTAKSFPSSGQVRRAFGNWTQAILAAGLNPTRWEKTVGDRRQIILEWIRNFYLKHGHVPTVIDLQKRKDAPSYGVVRFYFGNMPNAVSETGLTPRLAGQNTNAIPDEEQRQIIIKWLQDFHSTKGYAPRCVDIAMTDVKGVSEFAMKRLFGSIDSAVTLSGIPPRSRRKRFRRK